MITVTIQNDEGKVIEELHIHNESTTIKDNQVANHINDFLSDWKISDGKLGGVQFFQCDRCDGIFPEAFAKEQDMDLCCGDCV